jgi:predicted methyltransferase
MNHRLGAAMCLLLVGTAFAADRYDAAVSHAGRSAADIKRDPLDHPAEILRLTGIGPGMNVADVLAGDGYYSELLSYLVAPSGKVVMINNEAFDHWSEPDLQTRLAGNRLPNVEHRTLDLNSMHLPANSLDAALMIKVYHDLYGWIPRESGRRSTPAGCSRRLQPR